MTSPKALSFGAALFLVAAALSAKSLQIKEISAGNVGILGGPVALAAPQGGPDQVPMDATLAAGDPAVAPSKDEAASQAADLSTGTLDGSQAFQGNSEQKEEKAPSLLEKNEKAIKAVAALSEPAEAPTPKKSTGRYFIQPTSGKNWGILHNHNGVDIANSCGTPVVAAASGRVQDAISGGWNGGYGSEVLIVHPNGTKTRYAHLSRVSVEPGEEVEQGQQIGKIGNTGSVTGATGCHLHFEVLGGVNPFAHK